MAIQNSVWYMGVLSFNIYLYTKVGTSFNFKFLLHGTSKILDKPIFNQVKGMDAVIIFKCGDEVWMFVSLFNF
jgi:hypothetical protein